MKHFFKAVCVLWSLHTHLFKLFTHTLLHAPPQPGLVQRAIRNIDKLIDLNLQCSCEEVLNLFCLTDLYGGFLPACVGWRWCWFPKTYALSVFKKCFRVLIMYKIVLILHRSLWIKQKSLNTKAASHDTLEQTYCSVLHLFFDAEKKLHIVIKKKRLSRCYFGIFCLLTFGV